MKKIFVFAAIAAALFTLSSCNQDNKGLNIDQQKVELAFTSLATRGYVETTDFLDSPYDKLHPAASPDGPAENTDRTDRTMSLSAYITPQSGAPGNYFVGETFAKGSDNLWHHTPALYWPMGGQLSFLAFSATKPFPGTAIHWDETNASQKLVLDVTEDFLQDDIIFGSCSSRGSAIGDPTPAQAPVALTFYHTQAWLQFRIKVDDGCAENVVKLKDIIIKDLYTRGELTIVGGEANSENASWNFNKERGIDKAMDDTYNVTEAANFITETVQYMDMLVPSQAQTAFIMHYTLAGSDTVLEYKYELGTGTWAKGNKYIYEITFKPYEITVNPTVTTFAAANVSEAGFPSTIQ